MSFKISKWGNSLAFRIPSSIGRSLKLKEGTSIKLETGNNTLILTPLEEKKTYALSDLLESITEENLHEEINWGQSIGEEI